LKSRVQLSAKIIGIKKLVTIENKNKKINIPIGIIKVPKSILIFGFLRFESSNVKSSNTDLEFVSTINIVKEINKKSDLGDYGLLEPQPYPMEIPGSGMMNDGKDSFNCYPYADGYYVTRVFLSSAETNVLGISNGQKEDEADVVLQNEGFQKLSEKETENFFLAKEKGIAYAKYDITIAFRLSQDTELIDKMIVVVKRPIDDELTF